MLNWSQIRIEQICIFYFLVPLTNMTSKISRHFSLQHLIQEFIAAFIILKIPWRSYGAISSSNSFLSISIGKSSNLNSIVKNVCCIVVEICDKIIFFQLNVSNKYSVKFGTIWSDVIYDPNLSRAQNDIKRVFEWEW